MLHVRHPKRRLGVLVAFVALVSMLLSACNATSMTANEFSQRIKGVAGTVSTYDEESQLVHQVRGTSFQFQRDTRFDTSNSEGSNKDSSVISISLGNDVWSHVGSTVIFAQDGIVDVSGNLPDKLRFSNYDSGTPWLNHIRAEAQNLWQGRAMTIVVQSQAGKPLAVFAGDSVSSFATDIPKSTAFLVDGKYLLIYRADYDIIPTSMIKSVR